VYNDIAVLQFKYCTEARKNIFWLVKIRNYRQVSVFLYIEFFYSSRGDDSTVNNIWTPNSNISCIPVAKTYFSIYRGVFKEVRLPYINDKRIVGIPPKTFPRIFLIHQLGIFQDVYTLILSRSSTGHHNI